jgi:hypothetical protein
MRRPNLNEVRAGIWTLRSVVRCRRQIGSRDLQEIALPDSTHIPAPAGKMVVSVLRRRQDECLSNSLIAQAWRADHGDLVDVLIGVSAPAAGFTAHAWLEDAADAASVGLEPIHRIAPKRERSPAK